MVKAVWIGDELEVTPVDEAEVLPDWVYESIDVIGIAVYNTVAYAKDEETAREKLEF